MSLKPPSGAVVARLDRFGLVVLGVTGFVLGLGYAITDVHPIDATYYWNAGQSATYYGQVWGADAASYYVYPPPLAQLLGAIPWPLFIVSWTTLLFVGIWAATRWWSLPVFAVGTAAVVLFGFTNPLANPMVLSGIGNPQVLVAAAIVVGFRWPAAWAFPLLTKIAPGVGLLWFVVRREWRSLAIAVGVTVVIAATSFVLAPQAWFDFVRFASTNAGVPSPQRVVDVPFAIRAAMSVVLVVWGAATDRPWTVPLAVGWAAIALYAWSPITIWIGALPLVDLNAMRGPQSPALAGAESIPTGAGRP